MSSTRAFVVFSGRLVAVCALALSACSSGGGASVASRPHTPVSLAAGWLPANLAPETSSTIDTAQSSTDNSGSRAGQPFQPAAGAIYTGPSSDGTASALVLVSATWTDELPTSYWSFLDRSPSALHVQRGTRKMIELTSSRGLMIYFQDAGLVVMTTSTGLTQDESEHAAEEIHVGV